MADAKKDKLQIRNSTVDFLVFTKDAHEDGIEVRVQDHDVWLTQKAIARLFDVDRSVVTKHLKNVYESGELSEDATCANFAQVADNGKTYHYKFYSLSAIIAVGYRINSGRATQFRQWATKVLDTFTKQGYVLDKSRLINGQIFDEDYFDHLISEIQEIRASERRFYQKITDIYATAVDYSLDSQTTKDFFATVQNKMHYAVHGGTAAEVIMARADHTKEHMGLTSWKNAPDGKIVKADVSVAKNYLSMDEMQELNEIVTMYLDYAMEPEDLTVIGHTGDLLVDIYARNLTHIYILPQCSTTAARVLNPAGMDAQFERLRCAISRGILSQNDFLRAAADAVHAAYPFHLIGSFECFGHAFLLHHCRNDDFHALVAGLVDLGKVPMQRSVCEQVCVENRAMFFQIAAAHMSILANLVFRFLWQRKVWNEIIALLTVSAAHFLK